MNFDEIALYNKTYIIAEMSANHAGKLSNALEIVHAAKEAGADCLKIQTYTADTLTIDCDNEYFRIQGGLWDGYNLYNLYQEAYTPWEWQKTIKDECEKVGLDFLSTPFDNTSVDFLEELGVKFYKIASFELVDIPLIEYVASKGKPIIMSCGMASIEEIQEAIEACKRHRNNNVTLLKCCSEYPAKFADMNLATISDLRERFGVNVGLSDHSIGFTAAIVAVTLGAKVIEKHFCLDRRIKNPDSEFSMEPHEFKKMVEEIHNAEKAKGVVSYELSEKEKENIIFRRSIFAVRDIKKGDVFTKENVRCIRPGYGMKPKYYCEILGKTASENILRGDPLKPDLVKELEESFEDMMSFREAMTEDMDLLYNWANDSEVRANSFKSNIITYKEHEKWFEEYLSNDNFYIYICMMGDKPIGQIKLKISDGTAWISFSVDKQYRGRGIGKRMLCFAEQKAKQKKPIINQLVGDVKINNTASQKVFEANSYIKVFHEDNNKFYRYSKEL